jgi:DNA polymerase type B, organellar and viral
VQTINERTYNIIAADLETDPFQYDRWPQPFAAGFYDGSGFYSYWGDDCVEKFLNMIATWPASIVYLHNGGKFDLHFLLPYIQGPAKIINSRIVEVKIGPHIWRDSYSILPASLRTFNVKKKVGGKTVSEGKKEIDYRKMERDVRHKHKKEIMEYLQADCVALYKAVDRFCAEFAPRTKPKLTMAATAMAELKKSHQFETMRQGEDAFMRKYFFGGRCQVFKGGIMRGRFQVFDVNSMYPTTMKTFLHPISAVPRTGHKITNKTAFVTVEADNFGAFAARDPEDKSLNFDTPSGIFHVSIHELNAALETGTARIRRIVRTVDFDRFATFAEFVDIYYGKRMAARDLGDELLVIFYKFILNGAYGKFAQQPDDFKEYRIEHGALSPEECRRGIDRKGKEREPWQLIQPWKPCFFSSSGYLIYETPAPRREHGRYNVATGASITGAARALLLRGIGQAKKPIYTDTDSIICSGMDTQTDPTQLGAWKLEAKGTVMAIAGKKLYTLLTDDQAAIDKRIAELRNDPNASEKDHFCMFDGRLHVAVKTAHKGAHMTPGQIVGIARGETVTFENPVPTYRVFGKSLFQTRKIRSTV